MEETVAPTEAALGPSSAPARTAREGGFVPDQTDLCQTGRICARPDKERVLRSLRLPSAGSVSLGTAALATSLTKLLTLQLHLSVCLAASFCVCLSASR